MAIGLQAKRDLATPNESAAGTPRTPKGLRPEIVLRAQRAFGVRRVPTALAVVLLFAAIGCRKSGDATRTQPPTVTVMTPQTAPVQESVELSGTFDAYQTVNLVARVEGTLTSIDFKDGAYVEKGALLFTIERDTYEEQLKLYEAQLESAEAEYQRQLKLAKQNATSVANVEKWLSQRDQARAQVALSKINLGYTRITAPFNGRIGKHLVDVGNLVGGSAGVTQLATIQQLQPLYVSFNMNEREVLRAIEKMRKAGIEVKQGIGSIPVFVGLTSEKGFPHRGVLDFAANEVDTSSGTVELRAEFANTEKLFFPGLFARVRIPFGDPAPTLVVPNRAVSNDQAGDFVLVVDSKNVVVRKNVKTGPKTDTGMRAIEKGLEASDRVIVEGLVDARIGETVEPVTASSSSSSSIPASPEFEDEDETKVTPSTSAP
jgi:RND family efflux transporter MFP subunit